MTSPTPYVADRTTAAWQELDRQHYLHPFTDYKNLHAKGARVIVKAEGVYLYDSDGNRILDGMAGLWCVNLGYGRRELAEAAYRRVLELARCRDGSLSPAYLVREGLDKSRTLE